ncbi:MAG TPA: putative quinol monooxygenase [Acidimicrobiales bacterium]|nr:putative quinol monooxygenase [Acidimicrobiales bacterium]
MIIVSGTLRLDPAEVDTALQLGATMTEASLAEAGCSAYGFWQDPADPTRIHVFEEWASQEALDEHFATPHMAAFMEGLGRLSISDMEVSKYEVSQKAPLF